jgi:hypothetical protein
MLFLKRIRWKSNSPNKGATDEGPDGERETKCGVGDRIDRPVDLGEWFVYVIWHN